MSGMVARTVPVSGSAVWFWTGRGSAGRFALPAVGTGKGAGEGSANRPGERFGGLISDGLRLSGTLRPTVGRAGKGGGEGSANRPGERFGV